MPISVLVSRIISVFDYLLAHTKPQYQNDAGKRKISPLPSAQPTKCPLVRRSDWLLENVAHRLLSIKRIRWRSCVYYSVSLGQCSRNTHIRQRYCLVTDISKIFCHSVLHKIVFPPDNPMKIGLLLFRWKNSFSPDFSSDFWSAAKLLHIHGLLIRRFLIEPATCSGLVKPDASVLDVRSFLQKERSRARRRAYSREKSNKLYGTCMSHTSPNSSPMSFTYELQHPWNGLCYTLLLYELHCAHRYKLIYYHTTLHGRQHLIIVHCSFLPG